MKMRKILTLAPVGLAVAAISWGCTQSPSTSSSGTTGGTASNGSIQIALIPMGATDDYWQAVHAGAAQAVKDAKMPDSTLIFQGPQTPDDPQSQTQALENMLARGVAGIELAPVDPKAMEQAAEEAKNKNVPLVTVDSPLDGNDFAAFVGTNNLKAGAQAADEMNTLLNGKGKVLVLRMKVGQASTEARGQGFLDEIKKFPGIQVVDVQYGGVTADASFAKSEEMLQGHRKADGSVDVNGVFAVNEATSIGMLKALQGDSLAGKVKFIGFDSTKILNDALAAGQLNALVVQDPFKIGYEGFNTLMDVIHGKTVAKNTDTGATVITTADCNTPASQKLLNPPRLP